MLKIFARVMANFPALGCDHIPMRTLMSKVNIHWRRLQAKCTKLERWCKTLKAWQHQHLKVNVFLCIGFIVMIWCLTSSVGLIHY